MFPKGVWSDTLFSETIFISGIRYSQIFFSQLRFVDIYTMKINGGGAVDSLSYFINTGVYIYS